MGRRFRTRATGRRYGCSASVLEKLPYIVVLVDEFADLMMTVGKVEKLIARLARSARCEDARYWRRGVRRSM